MRKYSMPDKALFDKEHLKVNQRNYFHLLPSIVIFGEGNDGKWDKITSIEIAWLYWEVEIYFY